MENYIDIEGIKFIEFGNTKLSPVEESLTRLGLLSTNLSADITLYQRNDVTLVFNKCGNSFASKYAQAHGPTASAIGVCVSNVTIAVQTAVAAGYQLYQGETGDSLLNYPAVLGIGGMLIYFLDKKDSSVFKVEHDYENSEHAIQFIDHLAFNVNEGESDYWKTFFTNLFGFKVIRDFHIDGKHTSFNSLAMANASESFRIVISEPVGNNSQISEYLTLHAGPGLQHLAFATANIQETVKQLCHSGIEFMQTPDTYYEDLDNRIADHGQDVLALKAGGILMDGSNEEAQNILLQTFTGTLIGPMFFELIQRLGNDGFGEGNIKALFESVERDQIRRGVLIAA